MVLAEDCWMKSLVPLMAEIRQQMADKPLYISFGIDALDPAYAPGTGTPEIAGLTPSQVSGFAQWIPRVGILFMYMPAPLSMPVCVCVPVCRFPEVRKSIRSS